MKIEALGHVVIKVRDQQRAEEFYNGLLGMPIVARNESPPMTFFSMGNHHDFAIMAVGNDAGTPADGTVGLAHVAFKIGNQLSELSAARDILTKAGVRSAPIDHEVTKSLYLSDPDGNQVELYIDASDAWKTEPQRVAQASPLEL
jgi:catechol 2,3-dioxygenase